uniref:Uncharacterized protein n=1 Tax=Sphaerodactylus townsendi TaxID=933632 RepID=A0ACB8FA39_9SAUR
MMTGAKGGGWMMTEFQDVMKIGDHGVMQMRIESQGVMMIVDPGVLGMTTEALDVETIRDMGMIPDLDLGDLLANQVDGEKEKKLVKTAGGRHETPGLQKIGNGIKIKIVTRMKRTERLTKIVTWIEKIVLGVLGMMLAGGKVQLKKPPAGEIQVVVMNGIDLVVTLEMTGVAVTEIDVEKKEKREDHHLPE